MDISVIIVNYNVCYYLEQCLHAVLRASASVRAEIIVVDNHSSDDSRAYLPPRFQSVKFIWLNTNKGFSVACNIGLKVASGKYILFLNPDTLIPENCFSLCISFLESQENPGAMGVRMIDGSGNFLRESKRGFPTPMAAFFRMSGLTFLMPSSKKVAAYYAGDLSEHRNGNIDVVAGAFMMVPKKVLEITGGFDESYFMYGEDIDLSYRICSAGFQNLYFSNVTIIHFKGESTVKNSVYTQQFYGAMKIYIQKHLKNRWSRFSMNVAIRIGKAIATIKSMFSRQTPVLSSSPIHAAVVTSQPYFTTLVKIIQRSPVTVMLHGRIAVSMDDEQFAIADVNEIPQLLQKNIRYFILSTDVLSYQEIIRMVEKYTTAYFMFHASGSNSIISSPDKNKQGFVVHD
jgi:GT2 family glycosyltransferase